MFKNISHCYINLEKNIFVGDQKGIFWRKVITNAIHQGWANLLAIWLNASNQVNLNLNQNLNQNGNMVKIK